MATDSYYYADASKKPVGPYSLGQLQDLAFRGVIRPATKVIRKGDKAWVSYSQLPAAPKPAPAATAAIPPIIPSPTPSPTPEESTSAGGSFFNALPKPVFFGLMGAVGCLIGGLFGEPVLSILKADTGGGTTGGNGGAAPVLVFSPELKARLARENAEAGAIEIALIWNAYDDLDLHCIDPSGSHIFFGNERSPSGGWLDVDMNVGANAGGSLEPVEHIRWQEGEAPEGEYQVSVVHYDAYSSGSIPFTVAIKANNEIKEFKMTTQGVKKQVPVYTFRFEATDVAVTKNPAPASPPSRPSLKAALIIGVWAALLAVCTSLLLVMGQNHLLRRPLLTGKSACAIFLGGAFAGLVSGFFSQYLFSLGAQSIIAKFPDLGWLLKAGLVVGWMLLGGFLGAGMGWFIPNLSKIRSGFAGVVGGFLGALAFLLAAAVVTDLMGRVIGTFILGFAIGLMVALVEQLTRKAWLVVNWTQNQASTVNLGEKPVTIGGSRNDDIRIQGLAENTLSIILSGGKIQCTRQPQNQKMELKNQSAISLGKVRLVVHAKGE